MKSKQPGYVDVTPTWAAMVPLYALLLTDGDEAGRKTAKEELLRMANALDKLQAGIRKSRKGE